MFRNIIKKFALSLVADDIKSLIDTAVSEAIKSNDLASKSDLDDLIDIDSIADDVASKVMDDIDFDDLASKVEVDHDEVARCIDTSDIAENIDTNEIAENIAENIDMDAIAEAIDLDDLAKAMARVHASKRKARLLRSSN
jgi:hypothetical protein